MKDRIKLLDISMLIAATIAIILSAAFDFTRSCEKIRESAFRLHILANSDSAQDQRVKYALRDYIINDLGYIFASCPTKTAAKESARRNLSFIEERANEFLLLQGCPYTASCKIERVSFPTRMYGSYTLPAGEYDSLQVTLGEGKGKNWWCVLYPSVCLPAVSEKKYPVRLRGLYQDEKASARMTADSRAADTGKIEFRFALYELFLSWFGGD